MEDAGAIVKDAVTILDVLAVWSCARAIFEHVPVRDLVRSERVSRRWQHTVNEHLPSRSLCLINIHDLSLYPERTMNVIRIQIEECFWPKLCKTLDKIGFHIKHLIANCCAENYIETIAEKCPNLQHIELTTYRFSSRLSFEYLNDQFLICGFKIFNNLKSISLQDFNMLTDLQLDRRFQTIDCEKLEINNSNLTGSFLEHIETINLRFLSISKTRYLDVNKLMLSVSLQNLISLELNNNHKEIFGNIHLILNKISKLEELILRSYDRTELSQELIDAFRRLVYLKRLDLRYNRSVNTNLLEALAQGSQELQYLALSSNYLDSYCSYGIAALCRATLMSTLCLENLDVDVLENFDVNVDDMTSEHLGVCVRSVPVVRKLEDLGIVELSPKWLASTSHFLRGRGWPAALWVPCTARQTGASGRNLQIILADIPRETLL